MHEHKRTLNTNEGLLVYLVCLSRRAAQLSCQVVCGSGGDGSFLGFISKPPGFLSTLRGSVGKPMGFRSGPGRFFCQPIRSRDGFVRFFKRPFEINGLLSASRFPVDHQLPRVIRVENKSYQPDRREEEHSWIIGPATVLTGLCCLVAGWWFLWNCVGWWPEDRRNVLVGVLMLAIGIGLIWWGIAQMPYLRPSPTRALAEYYKPSSLIPSNSSAAKRARKNVAVNVPLNMAQHPVDDASRTTNTCRMGLKGLTIGCDKILSDSLRPLVLTIRSASWRVSSGPFMASASTQIRVVSPRGSSRFERRRAASQRLSPSPQRAAAPRWRALDHAPLRG